MLNSICSISDSAILFPSLLWYSLAIIAIATDGAQQGIELMTVKWLSREINESMQDDHLQSLSYKENDIDTITSSFDRSLRNQGSIDTWSALF